MHNDKKKLGESSKKFDTVHQLVWEKNDIISNVVLTGALTLNE